MQRFLADNEPLSRQKSFHLTSKIQLWALAEGELIRKSKMDRTQEFLRSLFTEFPVRPDFAGSMADVWFRSLRSIPWSQGTVKVSLSSIQNWKGGIGILIGSMVI